MSVITGRRGSAFRKSAISPLLTALSTDRLTVLLDDTPYLR
jgi:hypothetical protein